ncbi:hypothetical protein M2475_000923 [Breznakia sp. PF5-3]|uniref:hypothetical protein n=1 Tax=unclassified Breznakia TaxID=2623764 RepID=UPI00240755C2|nr:MULTISPECIES: hypothetical protein [unclassified Breznakia]MDF9824695.1 hypothetical protein [Breznakia sp. PM6-1]MDF9835358.1 hypothetical protein [Breznakia sp. PF5-3]MDF9836957.1 hypothetical protein [Breznakia sp. PFB2-8]MDF9859593.1 hypothetical protein [Breznakia sp. PH5-24]
MKKGQTSVRNGIEDILFPMEICNITQGDNEGTHKGTYAVDLAGKDSGRDYAYFPFSARSVALDSAKNGNAVIWESLHKVRFADGTIDYCCMMVIHDNDPTGFSIGSSYKQGVQMAQEGTAGIASGNHLHVEVAKGKYQRGNAGMYEKNKYGIYHLKNNMPIEKVCFMDNTKIIRGIADWKYLKDVDDAISKKLYLPKEATGWYVYPLHKRPVIGNQIGSLNPSKYGGLSYQILATPMKDVATIETKEYGKVNIYVATNTGAIIK